MFVVKCAFLSVCRIHVKTNPAENWHTFSSRYETKKDGHYSLYQTKMETNMKRFKQTLIYYNTDTVCKCSGKSPLSSHKMTLKQQIND